MARTFWTRSTHATASHEIATWVDRRKEAVYANAYERKERVLEEALDAYCALRDAGEGVRVSDFCRRYPSYQRSLRRLIDVHDAFDRLEDQAEELWPEVGCEFLGFQLLEELGVGAFAQVFLASEPALGDRLVALKITMFGDAEAETLGRLSHPNIVPIHSVQHVTDTGMTAVCMPFLGASTLADVLDFAYQHEAPPRLAATILGAVQASDGPGASLLPDPAETPDHVLRRSSFVDGIVHLGIQIAEALDATHRKGILHRDMKPSNVLVTPSGRPMLLDFNLSCDQQRERERLGGTLPYMPPEQIEAVCLTESDRRSVPLSVDPRSDIFALGVVLYESLSGTLPYGDPVPTPDSRAAGELYLAAQQRRPRPLEELNPAVDRPLARLVERCISTDVADRPVSAAELVSLLRDWGKPSARAERWILRNRIVVGVAATILLAFATVLGWHLATRPSYGVRMYLEAIAHSEAGRHDEALDRLELARRAYPEDPHIPFAEGIVRWRQEEYELTTRSFERAIEMTDDPLVRECHAYSYTLRRMQYASIAHHHPLVEEYPEHVRARINLATGLVYYDPDEAERHASAAIAASPHLRIAYELRAYARYEKAVKARDGFDYDRNYITSWLEEGWQDAQMALALGSDNPHQRYVFARILKMLVELDPSRKSELGPMVEGALETLGPHLSRMMLKDEFAVFAGEAWYGQMWARAPEHGEILYPRQFFNVPPTLREINEYLWEFNPDGDAKPAA